MILRGGVIIRETRVVGSYFNTLIKMEPMFLFNNFPLKIQAIRTNTEKLNGLITNKMYKNEHK